MNKQKIIRYSVLTIVLIFVVAAFIVPATMDMMNRPVYEAGEEVLVVIEDNTSTFGIGRILTKNKLIRSPFAFFIKSKTTATAPLVSGTYTLNRNMTMEEIIQKLSEPKIVLKTMKITFPEGYTVEQMAELVEQKGLTTKEEFLAALEDEYEFDFLKNIPEGEYNYALQGFLFPSTYEFYENSSAHDIIHKMIAQFEVVYKGASHSFENVFEVVTKASMIEKEAKLEKERPIIAGVIENRIEQNMAFQIDATVLYAATNGLFDRTESRFIADNIENLASPYNTYMYPGLPAGPICNPGTTSIEAALNPLEHSYLYYHTDTKADDGSHIFTETWNAHINTMR